MPICKHTQSKHPLREGRVQQQIKGREKDERQGMAEIQPTLMTFIGIHPEKGRYRFDLKAGENKISEVG